MIVSHRHKFIFMKTRKTAGTSIEVALSPFCGDDDIITPVTPEDEAVRQQLGYRGPQNCNVSLLRYRKRDWRRLLLRGRRRTFYNHMPAVEAKRFLGSRVWNSYFKFCFDRNPWDRLVSAYHWHKYQTNEAVTFDEFLAQQRPYILSNFEIYSIDSKVAVDFVGRYENLREDLDKVLAQVGIPGPVELPRLKGAARTDKRPYREVITPDQQAQIERLCRAEIDLMGYRFA